MAEGGLSASDFVGKALLARRYVRYATDLSGAPVLPAPFLTWLKQNRFELDRDLTSAFLHAYHAFQAVHQQAGRFVSKADAKAKRKGFKRPRKRSRPW